MVTLSQTAVVSVPGVTRMGQCDRHAVEPASQGLVWTERIQSDLPPDYDGKTGWEFSQGPGTWLSAPPRPLPLDHTDADERLFVKAKVKIG